MFDHPSFDQYERVVFAHDAPTRLHAVVASHAIARGLGGDVIARYAPCALFGGDSIPKLHTAFMTRAAVTTQDATQLPAASGLYARDYVIDADGIMSVGREYLGGAMAEPITAEIHRTPTRFTEFFARSSASPRPTNELADESARQLLSEA